MTERRPLYVERVGWIGFGRASPQLDLFESTWRLGFWRVSVSKQGIDLIAIIKVFRRTTNEAISTVEDRFRNSEGR